MKWNCCTARADLTSASGSKPELLSIYYVGFYLEFILQLNFLFVDFLPSTKGADDFVLLSEADTLRLLIPFAAWKIRFSKKRFIRVDRI